MANNVIPLRTREGSHLATIELWRHPAGHVYGFLLSMPKHVIEDAPSTAEGLRQLSEWTAEAAVTFRSAAESCKEEGK